MKKITRFALTLLIVHCTLLIEINAQVGINNDNSTPDASAMLDVKSSDKGMLVPRMSSSQRTMISDAATGLLVFDTDTESFWFKDSNDWVELVSGNVAALADADGDTKIQVEESADEDIIRFDIENIQVGQISKNASNNGAGLFIGSSNNTFLNVNPPNNTGDSNIFIGSLSGDANTTGRRNVFIGTQAAALKKEGENNVFLGTISGLFNNGSRNVFVGDGSGNSDTLGNSNTFLGFQSGVISTGSGNVFIGRDAGGRNVGSRSILIGYSAGINNLESNRLYIENSQSSSPLIYGEFDNDLVRINGDLEVTGSFPGTDDQTLSFDGTNLSIADGNSVDISSINSVQSIIEDADGDTKIQVEESADEDVIRFDLNSTEILRLSKNNNGITLVELPSSGANSTLYGEQAGESISTGQDNTFIGKNAGANTATGRNNTFVGRSAGRDNVDGISNTYVGSGAGTNASGSFNIFIGKEAGVNETGSQKLYIQPSNSALPLIYGEFDNDLVRINGDLEVTGSFPDTDDQSLAFNTSNNTLSIADGNSVDLSSIDTDTDDQTLTYNNTNKSLSISGGNTADLTLLAVPVGTIIMWIGDENESVPAGWLVCNNSTYNTTTYPDLFALLGSNRTPNFLGRFPVGAPRDGINGATGITVGGTGGTEDKTLSVANLPPHSHDIRFREGEENGSSNDYSDINAPANEKNATGSTESTGDGTSFKIMPPFLGVQFLIKAN